MEEFHALPDLMLLHDKSATEDFPDSQLDPVGDLTGTSVTIAALSPILSKVSTKFKPKS